MSREPPISTLFPYTTLFRSRLRECAPVRQQGPPFRDHQCRSTRPAFLNAAKFSRRNQGTQPEDRKSTRLNSSHSQISYAVFCLKKKINNSYTTLTIDSQVIP